MAAPGDPDELDPQWTASYAETMDEVTLAEEPGQRATARRTLDAIERHVARGVLADIGCWTGALLATARDRGWTTIGVEPSEWAVAQARARGLDVRRGTVLDVDLPRGACDAVVVADVLEHLWDPAAGAASVRRLLGPGGVLLATVPDAGSVVARVLGRRWWSVLPMHVQFFSRASLTSLLKKSGFEVVEVGTHPKTFSARYYADRFGAFIPGTRRLVTTATRAAIGDRLVTPDFRDRLMVVAEAS